MSSEASIEAPARAPGAVAERVRAASGSMPPAEARAVQALLGRGADVINASVTEIAAAAETGVATVVRACQSLGFKGFQAAKIALAQDLLPLDERPQQDVSDDDEPLDVLMKLASSSGEALRRATASVSAAELARAIELLASARRVLCLGVGTSAPLAQDAAYRLTTIGIDADAPPDVHVQHVRARLLSVADVAMAISHTGATQETLGATRGAKEAGARVIAVTSFSTTPLTELADVVLVAGGYETTYRVEAMASRLAHLLVVDSLYTSLVLAGGQRAKKAQRLAADVLAEHRY
jgi:RpiR family transcriptional regulator, carbohydrate utilization regulator